MTDKENRRITQDFGGDELNRRVAYAIPPGESPFALKFWQTIEAQLEQCGDILEENGFARDDFKTDGFKDPYQDAWYAAQVGWRCRMVLDAHAEGKPLQEAILLRIMQIGAYAEEWEWRLKYRPSIVTGAKQRRYLGDLRDAQNKRTGAGVVQRREAIAALLRETNLTRGALTIWIRKQLIERHKITVSDRTIRDDLKALRQ